jgi:exodeoxyribonuclease VII large subunit
VHDRVTRSGERLNGALRGVLDRAEAHITTFAARLDALSPLAVLGRGYAIARGEDGHVLRRVEEFPPGLRFRLRLTDGEVHAQRTADG